MTRQHTDRKTIYVAGGSVIALAALSILFMAHHPTLGGPGHDTVAAEAAHEAGINGAVHGALIAVMIGFYVALSFLSDALGRHRLSVRAAQASLAAATAAMAGAALVSGFIAPATAASLLRADAEAEFSVLLRLLVAANQSLANMGTLAYGAAIVFWSLRLAAMSGFPRIVGAAGLLVGAGLIGGMLSSAIRLDVPGMTFVLVIMVAWFSLAAIFLVRGAFSPGEDRSNHSPPPTR